MYIKRLLVLMSFVVAGFVCASGKGARAWQKVVSPERLALDFARSEFLKNGFINELPDDDEDAGSEAELVLLDAVETITLDLLLEIIHFKGLDLDEKVPAFSNWLKFWGVSELSGVVGARISEIPEAAFRGSLFDVLSERCVELDRPALENRAFLEVEVFKHFIGMPLGDLLYSEDLTFACGVIRRFYHSIVEPFYSDLDDVSSSLELDDAVLALSNFVEKLEKFGALDEKSGSSGSPVEPEKQELTDLFGAIVLEGTRDLGHGVGFASVAASLSASASPECMAGAGAGVCVFLRLLQNLVCRQRFQGFHLLFLLRGFFLLLGQMNRWALGKELML